MKNEDVQVSITGLGNLPINYESAGAFRLVSRVIVAAAELCERAASNNERPGLADIVEGALRELDVYEEDKEVIGYLALYLVTVCWKETNTQ